MDDIINWPLISNPINWLIVIVMLVFVGYAAFAITTNATALLPDIGG